MRTDPGWRTSFSIVVPIAWLIFLIAWFAFYAGNFSLSKNFAIILLSILIMVLLVGGVWAIWAVRMIPRPGREIFKMMGFRWRIYSSMFLPIIAIILLIVWFWFFGENFNIWQHIAVFLIAILGVGGALGVIWARWGTKHSKDMEDFGREMEDFGIEIEKEFDEDFK